MNRIPFPLSATLPGKRHWQPACTLGFPFSTEISDIWSVVGSGIGSGSNSLKTATGEYFERRHFYTEVMPDIKHTLEYSLTANESKHFTFALSQTSNTEQSHENLTNHTFNLTKVIRTSDFTECHIPTACISLNSYASEDDNFIYPLKDTCGCSFHWEAEKSMFGALKECLERQFLIRFWLTGQYVERIETQQITHLLKGNETQHLAGALQKSGELVAFDISDPSFPGICIIVFYGHPDAARHVKYCTGMAYAETKAEGLKKGLEELWQTFRFMDLFACCKGDIRQLNDTYLQHFFKCNTYDYYTTITAGVKNTNTTEGHRTKNTYSFNLEGLLQALDHQLINGYFYLKFSRIENHSGTFCKFISPQLFMHMNNAKNINLKNTYSAQFLENIIPERQRTMVPFP